MLVICAGILVVDFIAASISKIPSPGELVFVPGRIEMHIGGHAGNVSIDLRKLGLQEGTVSIVSSVGEDLLGDYLEDILKKHGVVTHLYKERNSGTSRTMVIIVKDEDRRFISYIGANWDFKPDYVQGVLAEEKPLMFYVGGAGILGKFDEKLGDVLREARNVRCLTFVDPVTPFKHDWKNIISSLKWMDIFHCNIDEAREITGEKDPIIATQVLLDKGPNLVVVSLGQDGLIAMTKDKIFKMAAFEVPVVDPTGAGDAFCAGVIRGISRRINREKLKLSDLSTDDLTDILLEGEAAGAACVTMVGTTTAVDERRLDSILDRQKESLLHKCSISDRA